MPRSYLVVLISFVLLQSCKPRIISFTAEPTRVTSKDSVILKWKVKGKPLLMFDQVMQANPPADSMHLLEYTLYVTKGRKNAAHQKIQVLLLPAESQQALALRIESLVPSSDTAIARTFLDSSKWTGFIITSLSAVSNRTIVLSHAGQTGTLQDSSTKSETWRGKPYAGQWQILLPLTMQEKNDRGLIPDRVLLNVNLTKSNNR
ncbi:MAG: hypothetical protein ACJ749_10550 [Flavisolibacter sp.]